MKINNSLNQIIANCKGDNKSLRQIYTFVKNCSYFKGERRKIYKTIVKYKNKGGSR